MSPHKSDRLRCFFCAKRVSATTDYELHLKFYHKIRRNIQWTINRTEENEIKERKRKTDPSVATKSCESKITSFVRDIVEEVAQDVDVDQAPALHPQALPTILHKVPFVKLERRPSIDCLASKQNEEENALVIDIDEPIGTKTSEPLGNETTNLDVTPAKQRKISVIKEKPSQFENYDVPICTENFLTFTCNAEDCSESYDEAKDLVKHIQTCHKLTKDFAPCFREYGLFASTFKCELCNVMISKQKSSLVRHLSNHNLTLEQYQQRVLEEKRHTKVITNSYELSDFDSWLDGECVYGCFLCYDEIKGSTSFWKHMQDSHDRDKSVYMQNRDDSFLEEKSTFCALCLEEILHEEESISSHMKTLHNLTPLEYFKKSLVKKQSPMMTLSQLRCSNLFECQFCEFTSKWEKDLNLHLDTMHQFSFTKYTSIFRRSLAEMSLHECLICQKVIFLFEGSLDNHLLSHDMLTTVYHEKFFEQEENRPRSSMQLSYVGSLKNHPALQTDDKVFKAWLSKFAYDCPECETKEFSRDDIVSHIKSCHSGRCEKALKPKKKFVFKCKLCSKNFSFLLPKIDHHLRQVHGLTIDQYYYDHIRILFTYSIWSTSPPWKCVICNYTDVAFEIVQQHLETAHSTKDQSKLKTVDIHKCAMCKAKVNHDTQSLREHASTHFLDLKTYYVSKISRNFPSNINPRSLNVNDNPEPENASEADTSASSCPSTAVDEQLMPTSPVSEQQEPVAAREDCPIDPDQFDLYDIPNLESDSLFLPALQPSETRFKDFNKCIFYCRICNLKFTSFKMAKNHITSTHFLTLGTFLESYAPLNWEVTMYTCPNCNKDILHDLYIVETHMVTQHDSSLCCITKSSYVTPTNSDKSKIKTSPGEVSKEQPALTSKAPVHLLPEEPTDNCQGRAVSAVTTQISPLTQHLQAQSPVNIFQIQNLFHGSQPQQNFSFPKPRIAINSQLQLSSRPNSGGFQIIPISQQQTYTVSPNASLNSSHLVTASRNNSNPPNSGQNQILTFVQQPIQSTSTVFLPVASCKNFSATQTPQKHFFEWNNCFFFCELCPVAFAKYGLLASHVTHNHHMPIKDYQQRYPITKQEVMHTCLECDHLVECTKDEVMEHLFSQHALTLESYEKKYFVALCKIFDNLKMQLDAAARNPRKWKPTSNSNGNFTRT